MKNILIASLVLLLLFSCKNSTQNPFQKQADIYIKLISERKDVNSLMDLYSDSIQYDNMVIDEKFTSKDALFTQRKLEWKDSLYQFQAEFPKAISIENISYFNNNIILKGIITPYLYNDKIIPHKKFVTSLYFNSKGKIIKQEDWIDYPLPEILEIYNLQKSLEEGTLLQRQN